MESVDNLLETGVEKNNESAQINFQHDLVCEAVGCLHDHVEDNDKMVAESVWRLATDEARGLERRFTMAPPGGWKALTALTVGTGLLKAEDDGFVLGKVQLMDMPKDETDMCVKLLESFTKWLIPPSTAASLFLALDIHPLGGLRLARRRYVDCDHIDANIEGWKDEDLLPDENLKKLDNMTFSLIGNIMEVFSSLNSDRAYSLDAFEEVVTDFINNSIDNFEAEDDGLDVLIEDARSKKLRQRSVSFMVQELFDSVLLPAGVCNKFGDYTFAVDSDTIAKVG